jgi:hypothetical protein
VARDIVLPVPRNAWREPNGAGRGHLRRLSLPGLQSEHEVRAGAIPAPEVAHNGANVRQNGDAGSLAGLGLLRPEDRFGCGARHPPRRDSLAPGATSTARFAKAPSRRRRGGAALTSAGSLGTLGSDVGDHVGTSELCLERMFACADLFPGRRIRGSARGACAASGSRGASPARPRSCGGAYRFGLMSCVPAQTWAMVGARASRAQALTLL